MKINHWLPGFQFLLIYKIFFISSNSESSCVVIPIHLDFFLSHALEQRLTNGNLWAKSGQPSVFPNKALVEQSLSHWCINACDCFCTMIGALRSCNGDWVACKA